MAKHLDSELLAVLRQFEVAGELTGKKSIDDIHEYSERMFSRLIRFRFNRRQFYLLYSRNMGDDEHAILSAIHLDAPDVVGSLVRNPLETGLAYGMPFKGKDAYLFQIESPKGRLDVELATRYPEYSRSTIQKYIKAGHVSVNGTVQRQPKLPVSQLDEIALTPPVAPTHAERELPILYLDDHVIVVNKPKGILTHSKGAMNDEFTVADFFRRYTTWGLDTNRPGIVHRLDRDTSGVMIGARTEAAAELLKKQFADRTTKKTYQAVVDGVPHPRSAIIDLPIDRHPTAPSTFRVAPGGKLAQTAYEVRGEKDGKSLIELRPKTGRTHQLRVHLQYIKAPIHGDRVYGSQKADRLYLHAESLEITIPDARRMTFHAPLPPEFTTLVPIEDQYAR